MSETVKNRLFIAIDIPDDVRRMAVDHIARVRKAFPDARISWTKPDNLHLTLKFLGDVDRSHMNAICHELEESAEQYTAFELAICGTGVFPSARRPKVLWLGVEDIDGELSRLATLIEDRSSKLGLPREERNFSPHLTIGRVRERADAAGAARNHIDSGFESGKFSVTEIVLYDSKLSAGGSIYTPICRASLRSPID